MFDQKVPLVTWILFWTPVSKTSATNPEFLPSKPEKNVKLTFFGGKNPFVSKPLSGPLKCGVDNSAKIVSPRSRQIIAPCPKVKKIWFLPNFSLEMLRSDGHVESLPGSSSFSLKFLRTQTFHTRHHWRILFLRTWKFFAKIQEKYYNWIFLKKVRFTPKVVLLTWNAVSVTLPKLFCQKPKRFSLSAQKLESFVSSR